MTRPCRLFNALFPVSSLGRADLGQQVRGLSGHRINFLLILHVVSNQKKIEDCFFELWSDRKYSTIPEMIVPWI